MALRMLIDRTELEALLNDRLWQQDLDYRPYRFCVRKIPESPDGLNWDAYLMSRGRDAPEKFALSLIDQFKQGYKIT